MKPNFKPSKTVTSLQSGRTRDDSFDDVVRMANAERGKVFEDTVKDRETAEEYRKGLDRSLKYLNETEALAASLTKDFEEKADGSVTVRFAVVARRARRTKVNGDAPETDESGSDSE
jgi:hypothetical protein